MTDSRARIRLAIERRLDRVTAARRLAALLDSTGAPNPVHQAALFRARYNMDRFLRRLSGGGLGAGEAGGDDKACDLSMENRQ